MNTRTPLIAASLLAVTSLSFADGLGTVVSSTPVTESVAVPEQVCARTPVEVQPRDTGAGAVTGAIVGGLFGNAVGRGARGASTALGAVAGAVVGDRIEASNEPSTTAVVRSCDNETAYQQRVVGYDVAYDYAGRQFQTRLPTAPGATVAVDANGFALASVAAVGPAPASVIVEQPPVAQAVLVPGPIVEPAFVPLRVGWGPGWGWRRGYWR